MTYNAYKENGYKNRADYLACMAEEYGDEIYAMAELLGPSEDFDGLVAFAEDLGF